MDLLGVPSRCRGERAAHMALERCEVDHAMSWLSTLGGAFSALGEQFQHCVSINFCIEYLCKFVTLLQRYGDDSLEKIQDTLIH